MSSPFGTQGQVRYAVIVDTTQAEQGINRFKTSMGTAGQPVAKLTQDFTKLGQSYQTTTTGMVNQTKTLGTEVSTLGKTYQTATTGMGNSTKTLSTEMGALNNNFKKTEGGLTSQNTMMKNAANSTKSLGSQVKDAASKYSTFAIGLGSTVSQVTNLARQYRDLVDTQIQVDRTARKLSLAQEAVDKTTAKVNKLQAEGKKGSAEYANALRDQEQAQAMLKIATDVHSEALERQSDTYVNFATSVIPTVITAVGTAGSAFKDLGIKGSSLKGIFSSIASGVGGLVSSFTGLGKSGVDASTGIIGLNKGGLNLKGTFSGIGSTIKNFAMSLAGIGPAGAAAATGATAAGGAIGGVDKASKAATLSVKGLAGALGLIAIPLVALEAFRAALEVDQKAMERTGMVAKSTWQRIQEGDTTFGKSAKEVADYGQEVEDFRKSFAGGILEPLYEFINKAMPGYDESIRKGAEGIGLVKTSVDPANKSLQEMNDIVIGTEDAFSEARRTMGPMAGMYTDAGAAAADFTNKSGDLVEVSTKQNEVINQMHSAWIAAQKPIKDVGTAITDVEKGFKAGQNQFAAFREETTVNIAQAKSYRQELIDWATNEAHLANAASMTTKELELHFQATQGNTEAAAELTEKYKVLGTAFPDWKKQSEDSIKAFEAVSEGVDLLDNSYTKASDIVKEFLETNVEQIETDKLVHDMLAKTADELYGVSNAYSMSTEDIMLAVRAKNGDAKAADELAKKYDTLQEVFPDWKKESEESMKAATSLQVLNETLTETQQAYRDGTNAANDYIDAKDIDIAKTEGQQKTLAAYVSVNKLANNAWALSVDQLQKLIDKSKDVVTWQEKVIRAQHDGVTATNDLVESTKLAAHEEEAHRQSLEAVVKEHMTLDPAIKLTTSQLEEMVKGLAASDEGLKGAADAAKVLADAFNAQLAPAMQTFDSAIKADKWKDFKNAMKDIPGFQDFGKGAKKEFTNLINDFRKVGKAAQEVGTDISAGILGAFEGISEKSLGKVIKELGKDIEDVAKIDIDAKQFDPIMNFLEAAPNKAEAFKKLQGSLALMQDAMADGNVTAQEAESVMAKFAEETGGAVQPVKDTGAAMQAFGTSAVDARAEIDMVTGSVDVMAAHFAEVKPVIEIDIEKATGLISRLIDNFHGYVKEVESANPAAQINIGPATKNITRLIGNFNGWVSAVKKANPVVNVNTTSAMSKLDKVKSTLASIKDKTVTVTVNTKAGAAGGGILGEDVGVRSMAKGGVMSAAGGRLFTATGKQMVQVGDNPGARETVAFLPHNNPWPIMDRLAEMFSQTHTSHDINVRVPRETTVEVHTHLMDEVIVRKFKAQLGRNRHRMGI